MEVIQMQPEMRQHVPHPVTHTISVAGMEAPMDAVNLIHRLSELDGVLEVDASWKTGAVTMTYDLWRVHVEDVESALVALGFPPDDEFWPRMKLDWIEFHEHRAVHKMEEEEEIERMGDRMPWDP
ncbi:MAG: heavy-metal-associated domain-containing protein [Magnetococcales bacterium]|nr:heavy-metal-associated domain-containing protein [Magnetococcales bacterium]